jgi:hypothetical protein
MSRRGVCRHLVMFQTSGVALTVRSRPEGHCLRVDAGGRQGFEALTFSMPCSLRVSRRVRLAHARRYEASGHVSLGLALPGGVVT